jgi:ABC-type multidrug transport system fused ATPase/permease subunit
MTVLVVIELIKNMFVKAKRFIGRFFRKSRSVNNKPLNPVSLIVIIIVDLFILFNVFAGLDNISRWHISPSEAYPCISEWQNYRDPKQGNDKDYNLIASALNNESRQPNIDRANLSNDKDRLGKVSPICLNYSELKDKVNIPAYRSIEQSIDKKKEKISSLEQSSASIRSQYDSTLLEKIAGQNSGQSINNVSAEKAKQTLAQNKVNIATLKTEITVLKEGLLAKPESINLIKAIQDDGKYQTLTQEHQSAAFWYPSIQLVFQALFLLPLLAIALLIHRIAIRKNAGLVALITWHLLVIFFIPLLLKIFEFLQVGVLLQFLLNIVTTLFGGLLFLVSYLYIFLIPLIGFGIIKISQRLAPSNRIQETMSLRFQNQLCLNCAKRIRPQDVHCPHCGYDQYVECQSCHQPTYKHLAHCKQCGSLQAPISLSDDLPTGSNQ